MSGKKCDKCGQAYAGFGTTCSACRKSKDGGGSGGRSSVSKSSDTCAVCGKPAYAMERIQVEGETLHPSCFTCTQCGNKLLPGNFAKSQDGKYYCKTHYKALFQVAGRYPGSSPVCSPGASPRPEENQQPAATASAPPAVVKTASTASAGYSSAKSPPATPAPAPEPSPVVPPAAENGKPKVEKAEVEKVEAGDSRVKFEDSGKRWTIEKVDGGQPIYVEGHEKHHTVLIVNCKNIQVVIKGKVNVVSIDSCSKTQVIMDEVIGAVEVTNSKSIKFQITGSCPSASIDKTDGCNIFLMSEEAKKMQLSTSKHSDVQVTYMEGDECIEKPVPEQFVHTVQANDTVLSKVSSLYDSAYVKEAPSEEATDYEVSVGFPDMPIPEEPDPRARFEDSGRRWTIENNKGGTPIFLSGQEKHHTVLVYKCTDTTVLIKGKVNSVSIDGCSKTNVVMEHVIGVVEVTNSKGVKFQICGSSPSASIDKTDGCNIILMSATARKMQTSTSKHSDVQITYMNGEDCIERPVPEQFVHNIQPDGSVKSTVSSLYSS